MPQPQVIRFIASNGETINLNDGMPYSVEKRFGFGVPEIVNQTTPRSQRAGVDTAYSTFGERKFGIQLGISATSAADAQNKINALNSMLLTSGLNDPDFGTLIIEAYNDVEYHIRCAVKDGLQVSQASQIGHSRRFRINLFSESGLFYSGAQQSTVSTPVTYGQDSPETGRDGDPLPWTMGTGIPRAEINVPYAGDSPTFSLEVRITGPAEMPTIINNSFPGNRQISFLQPVPAGTRLDIAMGADPIQSRTGFTATLRNAVNPDNVIRRFDEFLAPDAQVFPLQEGMNELVYTQRNPSSTARVQCFWYNEFIGIGV